MRHSSFILILAGLLSTTASPDADPPPAADVDALRAELRSGDPARQIAAAKTLMALGEKSAAAAEDLTKLLDADSLQGQQMMHVVRPSPSLAAMDALLKLGPAGREALAGALRADKPELRLNAAYVLIHMGVEANFAMLLPAATDTSPAVRRLFISSLRTVSTPQAIVLRLAALKDSDGGVRAAAMYGLALLNRPPDPRRQAPAMRQIDNVTLSNVVHALTPVLANDSAEFNRVAAATALGELRCSNAVGPLMKALADEHPQVRVAAANSLGRLAHRSTTPALLGLLADKYPEVVCAAVRALGNVGDPLATNPLIPLLRHPVASRRRFDSIPLAAATSLGQIGDRRAVPALITALREDDDKVVTAAVAALGNIGDQRAADPLLELLHSRRPAETHLLAAMATALGQLREPRAIEPLAELLMDHKVLAAPVIAALENIRHPHVVVAVADRLVAAAPTPRNPFNLQAVSLIDDLTGHSFRFDYDGLKRWWTANRQRYLDAETEAAVAAPASAERPEHRPSQPSPGHND